jgi:hypothetical protein
VGVDLLDLMASPGGTCVLCVTILVVLAAVLGAMYILKAPSSTSNTDTQGVDTK